MLAVLAYNAALVVVDVLLLRTIALRRSWESLAIAVAAWLVWSVACMGVTGLLAGWSPLGWTGLLAWGVFVHGPLLGLSAWWLLRRAGARGPSRAAALGALLVVGIGVDAFFIEPHWLQVSELEVRTALIEQPVRIAVVADLQTDSVGAYEREVLELVRSQEPDLLLFAGDYLHFGGFNRHLRPGVSAELAALLKEIDFQPALGAYAVRGNVDSPDWASIFAGTDIQALHADTTLLAGELRLTALTDPSSKNTRLRIPRHGFAEPGTDPTERFHVVVGHRPDYALGEIEADLLLAGHCHGGQVRLPFLGPLVTLSRIPRAWVDAPTEVKPGQLLVVSRGVGLERARAARLRFRCRPEVVFVTVSPTNAHAP